MKPRIRLFQILLLLILLVRIGESDIGSDREALINLRRDFGGRTLRWNITEISPCLWLGVTCDSVGVTELRLPGAGLSGELPVGIGNLTRLRVLSLRFNALSGSVPLDLAKLSGLAELHLQGNSFSGEIPKFLLGMKSLIRLNLGSNEFSGEIPLDLNNLTNLVALYLDENRFIGSIPEISLPGLDQFNVSHNSLNGSIPEKLSKFSVASFAGNSLCGKPMNPCNETETETQTESKNHRRKGLSGGAIAGIVIGCVLAFLILAAILIILGRRKREKDDEKEGELSKIPGSTKAAAMESSDRSRQSGSGGGGGKRNLVFLGKSVRVFDLEDLLRASAEVLGKGTFGTAYKATLETGVTLAVKRLKDATVSEGEFRERMEQIGRLDHENLVPLRAYYFSRDEKLLVYDFMPMGSLSALLHGNSGAGRTPLNWETRSSIALGAARGITHLHSRGPFSSHANITSSNILLTRSYQARVSDFGLAHLATPNPTPAHRLAGYRAPEVVADPTKASSPEADVYSFGVLLLELLTGKPPVHSRAHHDDGVEDLPRWVRSVVRGDEWTEEVFDVELLRYRNVEDEMVELLRLALECTSQMLDKRPAMAEVAARIEELCRLSSLRDESAADDSSYAAD